MVKQQSLKESSFVKSERAQIKSKTICSLQTRKTMACAVYETAPTSLEWKRLTRGKTWNTTPLACGKSDTRHLIGLHRIANENLLCGFSERKSQYVFTKYFFLKSHFCTITPYSFNPISKLFCNFSLKLNMANRRQVLALWSRKGRNTGKKRKTNLNSLWNVTFKKVIRALAFRRREKLDNSSFFKIFGIVW